MSEVTSHPVGLEVTFEPDGRRVRVREPMTLYQAARLAGIDLETPCGGLGICGKCKVELVKGHSEITADERRSLTEHELSKGIRLACRHHVTEDTIAYIPDDTRSLVQQILASGASRQVGLNPAVRKVHLRVPSPSLADQRSDLTRLQDAIANCPDISGRIAHCELELELLRELPSILRAADGVVTAVLHHSNTPSFQHSIALESGDTSSHCYGIAFDIGTTTVVGYLMDLNTGHELAISSAMNAQTAYGDDLVSRIKHAVETERGRKQLRAAILKVVNDIIDEATQSAGVNPQQIYETVVVGNTCMTHLFLGIDPAPLGFAPYVPVVQQAVRVPSRQLGVKMNPHGFVHVLPNIAGFIGADTVGVLVALWERLGMGVWEYGSMGVNESVHPHTPTPPHSHTSLVVDIGTNGEIVLCHKGKMLACSAAAGPAFEGARISCGMRGAPGAISSVHLNETVEYTTIDERPPRGICGSGLIDAVAQMLEVGILEPSGRMATAEEAARTSHLNGDLRQRLITVDNERQFVLVFAEESATSKPITLSQRDVRQLQLAKGSICAAIRTLLKIAGVAPQNIDAVYLAGAFGTYLSKENALRIGLLPPEISPDRIHPVGNAAGAGARLALLSLEARQLADAIAQNVEHIELCTNLDYADTFMETMAFPER